MWTVDSVRSEIPGSVKTDIEVCRDKIRNGSRSFYAASFLLPGNVRDAAFALYAFCRVSDDAVDLGLDPEQALEQLRRRLDQCYVGSPRNDPVDRAFAWLVEAYALPRKVPESLLEGFAWDVAERSYATLDDVRAYGVRVAGTVGVMMSIIMGVRDSMALARACDLGIAMQLTNIARDIGEDARAGRIYLPQEWMDEESLSIADLTGPGPADDRVRRLTRRLLQEADQHYSAGLAGISCLPRDCRAAIRSAAMIYQAIGRRIAMNGYDSVSQRAYVPTSGKLRRLMASYLPMGRSADRVSQRASRPAQYLVDSVPQITMPGGERLTGFAWIIDLFMQLERREQEGRASLSGS